MKKILKLVTVIFVITFSNLTVLAEEGKLSDEMLFFTKYESGDDAYAQAGGDLGNACGKYQFDYRYSLLPFIKYVSKQYEEFQQFINLDYIQLQGNQKLFDTWKLVYEKDPKGFKEAQDKFAYDNYYIQAEEYLIYMGIDISERSDVIKAVVFSYAIQHGSYTAAEAVISSGIENSTSDIEFIEKLYNYRTSNFIDYSARYMSEKNEALSLLKR